MIHLMFFSGLGFSRHENEGFASGARGQSPMDVRTLLRPISLPPEIATPIPNLWKNGDPDHNQCNTRSEHPTLSSSPAYSGSGPHSDSGTKSSGTAPYPGARWLARRLPKGCSLIPNQCQPSARLRLPVRDFPGSAARGRWTFVGHEGNFFWPLLPKKCGGPYREFPFPLSTRMVQVRGKRPLTGHHVLYRTKLGLS